MLDIHATAYVSPATEVPFASVALTVHLSNLADETGYVTGKFRVYDSITGMLIHTSNITPLYLAGGASADVSALTEFDPPAPATSTYFANFDGLARNDLVPDGISFALGSFHFDVLPTGMGPAPAAHHATHENGGSDEVEVTGLSGLLADPQTPIVHDYKFHKDLYEATDFLNLASVGSSPPWFGTSVSSGTALAIDGSAMHPGIMQYFSSVSANSGYRHIVSANCILLAGGESSDIYFRPQTLAGTTIRAGFFEGTAAAAPVDGAYVLMDPATGRLEGRTITNSVGSSTATNYLLVTNTWYQARIVVNSDATRVDFYLYSEAGALLWTDSLTTNIPTVAGRETGHGIRATNSGTTAVALVDVDKITLYIPDRRPAN